MGIFLISRLNEHVKQNKISLLSPSYLVLEIIKSSSPLRKEFFIMSSFIHVFHIMSDRRPFAKTESLNPPRSGCFQESCFINIIFYFFLFIYHLNGWLIENILQLKKLI
jgi:hypothetical protein